MPLDKNGEEYHVLTPADLKLIRQRPYPSDVTRLTEMLDRRAAQLAREDRRGQAPAASDEAPRPRKRRSR